MTEQEQFTLQLEILGQELACAGFDESRVNQCGDFDEAYYRFVAKDDAQEAEVALGIQPDYDGFTLYGRYAHVHFHVTLLEDGDADTIRTLAQEAVKFALRMESGDFTEVVLMTAGIGIGGFYTKDEDAQETVARMLRDAAPAFEDAERLRMTDTMGHEHVHAELSAAPLTVLFHEFEMPEGKQLVAVVYTFGAPQPIGFDLGKAIV